MQTFSSQRRPISLLAGALLALNFAHPALAEIFTIDANQSSVTISGSILTYTLNQQGPGSLTTTYEGTLQAALATGTIQFTGQSLIQAQTNGTWQPKADGSSGSEPADYAATANAGIATAMAALRSIEFDATSPVINVANGQFDASSLMFSFPTNAASTLAYNISGFITKSGAVPLSGYATNKVTTQASLAAAGNQQTLTIPVDATFLFSLTSPNDTTVALKGQLVATHATTPPLTIQSINVQAQTVTLQWQSAPGQQFQVLSSTNFNTWRTNAANVTLTTDTYTWSGPATAPEQFFQIAN